MSEPKAIAGMEVADAEVELSAEDLLELSAPCENNNRAQESLSKTTSSAAAPSASALQTRTVLEGARFAISPLHVAMSLALVVAAMGASHLVLALRDDAGQSMTQQQAPEPQSPASAPRLESNPVRFANPFDANEVFEFPAGTSEAEARDAVAEVLMERAMKRQRQFDARVSNNS